MFYRNLSLYLLCCCVSLLLINGEEDVRPFSCIIKRLDDNTTFEYQVGFTYHGITNIQFIWYEGEHAVKEDNQSEPFTENGTTVFLTNSKKTIKLEAVLPKLIKRYYFNHENVDQISVFDIPYTQISVEAKDLRYTFGSVLPGNVIIESNDGGMFDMEINWSLYTVHYYEYNAVVVDFHQWKMKKSGNLPIHYIDTNVENNTTTILYALSSDQQRLDGTLIWSASFANINHSSPLEYMLLKLTVPIYESSYTEPYDEHILGFIDQYKKQYPNCPTSSLCTVVCEVYGFQPIDVELYRKDENRTIDAYYDYKLKKQQRYRLWVQFTIENMSSEREGRYICEATNAIGVKSVSEIQLFANVPVQIYYDESSLIDFEENDTYGFILTCKAGGHPPPSMTFRKNSPRGQVITNSTDYSVLTSTDGGRQQIELTIRQVDYYVYSYVCVASNHFNSDQYSFYP